MLMLNILKNYLNFIMIHEIHPFLPERMKIRKIEPSVTNLHDETENVIHIRNLKQALNHGLVLKNVQRMIQFKQKVLI